MLSLALLLVFLWPWQTLFVVHALLFALYLLWEALKKTPQKKPGRRAFLAALIFIYVSSPYLLYKAWDLRAAFSRIPEPLHSMWIEYRQEVEFGAGFLPSDNETGFVVYRLTDASAQWARDQGNRLGELLPGGPAHWLPTPVGKIDDIERWVRRCENDHRCDETENPPDIATYLDAYGFLIPLREGADAEANQAIRSEGSFYSYGRGGAVTIVDPNRGKVYFAYAG